MDKSKNFIVKISEGHFKNGLLNGFGRIQESSGECQVGFFKEGKPWGKYVSYYKDGRQKRTAGVYDDQKIRNVTIKTFVVNESPEKRIKQSKSMKSLK